MRVLAFLVQVLFWLLLLRLVLRGFARAMAPLRRDAAPPRAGRGPSPPSPRAIEDLVRDPVCHTYLPRSRALQARLAGREEHFCSTACRDKALAAVAKAS